MPSAIQQRRDATTTERSIAALGAATPWIARVGWLFVAVVGGAAVDAAVDGRSSAVSWTAAIGSWSVWAVVATAVTIASTRSLTIARTCAPLALLAAAGSALGGASALDVMLLVAPAVLTLAAVASAEFGRRFVQASAYGDEERFPLRFPAAAGAAALVSWCVVAPAVVAGPMLLAAGSWVVGAFVTVVAGAGIVFIGPRWHRLSKRWFVLVPAGAVLHDPVVLADTLPMRTDQIAGLRLAPGDTEAADLTGPASGYAIEVSTTETLNAVFAYTPTDPDGRAIHLRAFLVAPSRPGQTLRAAQARGLPVT